MDCEDSLCEQCNDAHQRVKVSKCHKRVAIEEFVSNPKLVLCSAEKPEVCKSHSKQSL